MKIILFVKGINYRPMANESRPYVQLSEDNRSCAISEAVIALDETVRSVSDSPEPNDLFSINGVDLTKDFDIGKVF
jgi:hypothetical protein